MLIEELAATLRLPRISQRAAEIGPHSAREGSKEDLESSFAYQQRNSITESVEAPFFKAQRRKTQAKKVQTIE